MRFFFCEPPQWRQATLRIVADGVVNEGVSESIKKAEARALRKVMSLVSEAGEGSTNRAPGVRLVARKDLQRQIPKFEIEDVQGQNRAPLLFGRRTREARERGVSRVAQILSGREMLSAAEFARFIGVSREAVRAKHLTNLANKSHFSLL